MAVAVGYLLIHVGLDRISYFDALHGFNITPWNPQAALAVAFLIWRPKAWWIVWIALIIAEAVVRGPPSPWDAEAVSCTLLTLCYLAIARAVAHWQGRPPVIGSRTGLVVFICIVLVGAAATSCAYIGSLAASGAAVRPLYQAALQYWIGDAVGMMIVLPPLFALGDPDRRAQSRTLLAKVEWWVGCMLIVTPVAGVFALSAEDLLKFSYLFFLPVVWLAARLGTPAATWGAVLVQVVLLACAQASPHQTSTVFELQILMAAFATTALILGIAVDERKDAAQALHASLHMAAAGEAAAALAHELNQPLTALTAYARASQLLAGELGRGDVGDVRSLAVVSQKLVDEAQRASDVVKRLRDFFRDRATELSLADLGTLVEEAVHAQQSRAGAQGIALQLRGSACSGLVWMDRVQIAIVLRNLVANAIDAAAATDSDRWVHVEVSRVGDQMAVSVRDSGSGVTSYDAETLFEPKRSIKPGGMGIGLSISRLMVDAHAGRLVAEPGPGGHFTMYLPVGDEELT